LRLQNLANKGFGAGRHLGVVDLDLPSDHAREERGAQRGGDVMDETYQRRQLGVFLLKPVRLHGKVPKNGDVVKHAFLVVVSATRVTVASGIGAVYAFFSMLVTLQRGRFQQKRFVTANNVPLAVGDAVIVEVFEWNIV
jgi:hypothetical protein